MNLLLHFLSEKPPLAVTEILWTSLKGSPHRRESSRSLASQSTAHSPGGLHGRGMVAVAFPGLFCMSIALQSFENSNQDWIYNYYIRYYKISKSKYVEVFCSLAPWCSVLPCAAARKAPLDLSALQEPCLVYDLDIYVRWNWPRDSRGQGARPCGSCGDVISDAG